MPINSLVSWFIKKRLHQMELFLKYPNEVQQDLLLKLVHLARHTEWGKQYDYSSISNYGEFRRRVPVQNYNDIKPYVERLKAGEQNILWHTSIDWFAKSSGTTASKSKFIPVSRETLEDCHYKGGKDLLSLYFSQRKKTKMYTGKSLILGGSSEVNHLRGDNSYTGDLSAIIINNLPLWVELRRTPWRSIALMDKWEEKIERMANATMKENVVNISGVPSWTLVLLKRILEINKTDNILDVWPNLELYMHGGVSFKPYREQFEQIIPSDNMAYVESYNASEGFFGIQDRLGADDMLLMLDYGIFYEFMPMSEYGKDEPQLLGLSDVEVGVNYALVITTNSGLWRYLIGDTIMFTNTNPYRIKVTGRTKHFINAFGEELIVENADSAIQIACERTGSTVLDYHGAPVYMTDEATGGHHWLIEFEKAPVSLEFFTEVFDNALKSLNTDYEAKRSNNLTLRPPYIQVMPSGTFYGWLKQKGKLGGQHKVPRLSNDRKHLEDILAFAESTALHA